jgi:type IV pilus assembly protein PilV
MLIARPLRTLHSARGIMLIEALIGILIFSIGILAMIGMQAAAFKASAEAKFRSDAAYLANSLVGRMWADKGNLALYKHRETSTAGQLCQPTGGNSSYAIVTTWIDNISNTLPGATAANQQIVVDIVTNQVTISVCWVSPQDNTPHRHQVTAYINL